MFETKQPTEYKDGRTKQSFKNDTDINKIMMRAEKTGTISHLTKYKGVYGDFADYDYFGNLQKLTRGREIFDELPAEIRNEFAGSPAQFFDYVNDPVNKDRIEVLLPGLAAPGRQNIKISPPTADEAGAAVKAAKKIEAVATSTGSETRVVASEEPNKAPNTSDADESSGLLDTELAR